MNTRWPTEHCDEQCRTAIVEVPDEGDTLTFCARHQPLESMVAELCNVVYAAAQRVEDVPTRVTMLDTADNGRDLLRGWD